MRLGHGHVSYTDTTRAGRRTGRTERRARWWGEGDRRGGVLFPCDKVPGLAAAAAAAAAVAAAVTAAAVDGAVRSMKKKKNFTIKARPRRAFGKRLPAPRKPKEKPGRPFAGDAPCETCDGAKGIGASVCCMSQRSEASSTLWSGQSACRRRAGAK